ncbi:hypothetical protein Tco_0328792 [Tanacetum coccineum]
MLTCRRTSQLGDEGLSSGGTKLISIFITAEVILPSSSGPCKFTSTFGAIHRTQHPNLPKKKTKEGMVDLQPMEEEFRGAATPRKLAYIDSDKEAPEGSLARGFSDRFSLESFGTSDTRKQTRSASKSWRTPSKNKELTHLMRSRRLEDRSITKEKARRERSKPKRKRSRHQETSSDSEREDGLEDACEDLNSPYKRPKPAPFTQRITGLKYHRRAKLPRNIRVYKGNKDLEDHLGSYDVSWKKMEEYTKI